jgi:Ca2+-binding RTX toxin-like protein
VSNNLSSSTQVDIVHINTEFVDNAQRASDHDPILAALKITPSTAQLPNVGTPGNDDILAVKGQNFDGKQDILFTGAGNDTVDIITVSAFSDAGNNIVDLGSGDDVIFVNKGDSEALRRNRAFGSDGNDIFDARDGKVDTPRSKDAGILNRIIVKTTARIISAFQVLP